MADVSSLIQPPFTNHLIASHVTLVKLKDWSGRRSIIRKTRRRQSDQKKTGQRRQQIFRDVNDRSEKGIPSSIANGGTVVQWLERWTAGREARGSNHRTGGAMLFESFCTGRSPSRLSRESWTGRR